MEGYGSPNNFFFKVPSWRAFGDRRRLLLPVFRNESNDTKAE
jgi:hypothetical protein